MKRTLPGHDTGKWTGSELQVALTAYVLAVLLSQYARLGRRYEVGSLTICCNFSHSSAPDAHTPRGPSYASFLL